MRAGHSGVVVSGSAGAGDSLVLCEPANNLLTDSK
jgi:hypothetical protein